MLPSAHTPAGSLRGLGRRVPKAVPRRLDLRVCRAVAAGPHLGGGDRILRYVIANDRAGYPVQNARLTSCKCTWRQRQDDCQSTNPPRQHETPPNLEKFSPTRDDQTRLAEANQSELGMAFITEYQHLTGAQPTQVSLLERGDRTLRIGARARIVRLRCLATSARHGKVQLRNGLEIDPSAQAAVQKNWVTYHARFARSKIGVSGPPADECCSMNRSSSPLITNERLLFLPSQFGNVARSI